MAVFLCEKKALSLPARLQKRAGKSLFRHFFTFKNTFFTKMFVQYLQV